MDRHPEQFGALNDRANGLCAKGQFAEAIGVYGQALALNPQSAEVHNNLGNALHATGRFAEAVAAYETALALSPGNADFLFSLGTAYLDQRGFERAMDYLKRAVSARPGFANAHYNLGVALERSGRKNEAVAAYRLAIAHSPRLAQAYCNLGGILQGLGETDEALSACRRAIEIAPNFAEAHNNLGTALFNSCQLDAAMDSYQRAAELAPGRSDLASNLLFTPYYDPNCDISAILERFGEWNRRFAEPAKQFIRPHHNDRPPGRRLRVGYVSPNLRAHAETAFVLPLLEHHDHGQLEVFCYSDAVREDAVTERLRRCADQWRETAGLSHAGLAERIAADRIDIVMDLTMHMAGGRLESLARKPAPVQVCWLAYPGTTGLAAMDYRITDPFVDPPGAFASHYSEESIRLPRTFACYDPAGMGDAEETGATRPASDRVVFGCLNNICKLNDAVMERFSKVLTALPESRLHLLCSAGEARRIVLGRLARFGVDEARVSFVGKQSRAAYMNEFLKIDVCLDTLPYCGHTTSLDSMWMGTPVVTRVGNSAAGRVGWSLMNNLGLTELAAQDDDAFVHIAADLAGDRGRLAELRRTLRTRLLASPIMDGAAFARDMEAAYRQMWKRWISGSL